MPATSFAVACEVSGRGGPPVAEPPLLGVWGGAQDRESVSFGPESAEPPVWRVSVFGDVQAASDWIAVSAAKVRASEWVLGSVNARVRNVLEAYPSGLSFSTGELATDRVEVELAAWLHEARLAVAAPSFAAEPAGGLWARRAWDDVASFLQRVRTWTEPDTQVETRAGSVLVGSSRIHWAGDIDTVWRSGAGSGRSALHARAVELAVQSRLGLFRVLGATARAASTVAARLALPGGAVLALPALWRFVNRTVGEIVISRSRPRDGGRG